MKPFDYRRSEDVAGAIALATSGPQARYLAGGTNLVDHMRLGLESPQLLVDVSRLPLDGIEDLPDGGLRIGATVRNSDLAADPRVRERYPVLSRALLAGASGQLRNLATTGGNLLQRTRCPYFQDATTPCNKREPGTGCSAIGGYTRDHAVVGASDACVAVHPSDMAVAMLALDAIVRVEGPDGPRDIPLDDFHRLPGAHPERDTVLAAGELITGVDVPATPFARRSEYRKVRDRASYAFALVSVAAAVHVDEGRIADLRIACGGIAHKPWRARAAEDVLRGRAPDAAAFAEAAEAELTDATPLRDNGFKIPMLRRTMVSVLRDLTEEVR